MLKLSLALIAALYAGFVIWGEPEDMASTSNSAQMPRILTSAANFDRPVILSGGPGDAVVTRAAVTDVVVPDAAAIVASAPSPSALRPRVIGDPVVVSLVQPQPAAAAESRAETAAVQPLLQVTGSRVNMRAGPSTADPVVASLSEGTLAEAVGPAIGGWQEIREIDGGRTGFMSARFLSPA